MFQTFKTLPELLAAFPTEQSAIDHFTAIHWRNGKFCPLCGNADEARIGTLTGTNVHKCYVCRKRFSIRVGTIFQDTKLPLRTWYAAIWMIAAHPKGIASTTLATDLGITQKSAWHVLHRIRHATGTRSFNGPLTGEVEIDETFIGGKEKNKHVGKKNPRAQGGGGKSVVVGLLERDGELRAGVVENAKRETIHPLVRSQVRHGETIYTDQASVYEGLGDTFQHHTVNHRHHEYVRGDVHTNSIEGVWAQLKRQIVGVHHWVSPKHLDRYVIEMSFRYNRRDTAKGDRVNALLAQSEGPLPYKVLIA